MIPLVWLAGVAVAGLLVAAFWKELGRWVLRVAEKIKEKIGQTVVGVKIFIQKMREGVQEISKHYSQNEEGRWRETVVTREIPESEVPEEFKKNALYNKSNVVDITEQLELKLRA